MVALVVQFVPEGIYLVVLGFREIIEGGGFVGVLAIIETRLNIHRLTHIPQICDTFIALHAII